MNRAFITVSIFVAVFLPNLTYALAGFGEVFYEYVYSENVLVEFNVPTDTCLAYYHQDQSCIKLSREKPTGEDLFEDFHGLDLLITVNKPESSSPRYILGRSYSLNDWLIYDLKDEKVLLRSENFGDMEEKWGELGNSKPLMVSLDDFRNHFHEETERSKSAREESERFAIIVLCGLAVGFIAISAIFLAIVAIIFYLIKKIIPNRAVPTKQR